MLFESVVISTAIWYWRNQYGLTPEAPNISFLDKQVAMVESLDSLRPRISVDHWDTLNENIPVQGKLRSKEFTLREVVPVGKVSSSKSALYTLPELPTSMLLYRQGCDKGILVEYWIMRYVLGSGSVPLVYGMSKPLDARHLSGDGKLKIQLCPDGAFPIIRYIVMERLEGRSITKMIAESDDGRIPIADAALLGIKIIDAVRLVHSHHVFHGDLKPSDVFLTNNGEIKMLGFERGLVFYPIEMDRNSGQYCGEHFHDIDPEEYVVGAHNSPWEAQGCTYSYRDEMFRILVIIGSMIHGNQFTKFFHDLTSFRGTEAAWLKLRSDPRFLFSFDTTEVTELPPIVRKRFTISDLANDGSDPNTILAPLANLVLSMDMFGVPNYARFTRLLHKLRETYIIDTKL